jgi:hypothetical protein
LDRDNGIVGIASGADSLWATTSDHERSVARFATNEYLSIEADKRTDSSIGIGTANNDKYRTAISACVESRIGNFGECIEESHVVI